MIESIALGILGVVLLLLAAKHATRVIAAEWFGAKRRHHLQVMKDCEQANGEN